MKRRIKLMKFSKLLVVLVVFTLIFIAKSTFAGVDGIGDAGVAEKQLGDAIVFSYYDIRTEAQGGPGLSDNYFTVVNNNQLFGPAILKPVSRNAAQGPDHVWAQAHVRVRTGQCSVELLDFDILLSPNDVFTFDLYQDVDGDTVFASCDTKTLIASQFNVDSNGCFILDTGTFPGQLSLIQECGQCPDGTPITAQAALEATRWGYVEVIKEVGLMIPEEPDPNCTEEKLESGETNAWQWIWVDNCYEPTPTFSDLFGKVYYARFDTERNLSRLATANATALLDLCGSGENDEISECFNFVLHRPCYSDNSPGCTAGDGELENLNETADSVNGYNARFAYDEALRSSDFGPNNGAGDMNYCFYKNTLLSTGDVQNRVGAGATFGPTLADLDDISWAPRNGDNFVTESIISCLNYRLSKRSAYSHYFYVPEQGQTRYAFTFPLQHFVNQTIEITKTARFDTEEDTCEIPTGKFISPGLPELGEPRGEVTIIETQEPNDSCTFNEGWMAFNLEITDIGPDGEAMCDDNFFLQIQENGHYPWPATLGLVTNRGDNSSSDVHAVSPMIFDRIPFFLIFEEFPCEPFPICMYD
jgi:hypothetical protein